MKNIVFSALLLVAALSAQSTGSVQTTPAVAPSPAVLGKVVATTTAVSCSVTGNAVPATAVSIACTVNGVALPSFTMPMAANHAYTFQQNFDVDAVTFIIQSDANKQITVSATANGSLPVVPTKF